MNHSVLMRVFAQEPLLGKWMMAFVTVLIVVIPIMNLLVPEGGFLHISTYTVTLLGKYLCFALLALSMDLAWGYLGFAGRESDCCLNQY